MSKNKLFFLNDTGRHISIHPATTAHGTQCDESNIKNFETREFVMPDGKYPLVKIWDYGKKHGLQILVSYLEE